jgi:hypothetical protein
VFYTVALSAGSPAVAHSKVITAVAKQASGQIAYTEKHEIQLSEDGKPKHAKTQYFGADNELRATLETDFKNGLAATDYTFFDNRDGTAHGVESKNEGYLVWKQSKDGKREEKMFKQTQFRPKDLVVAGQGLFFYLRTNLKQFNERKSIPVKLLIPGRLDYFSFDLSVSDEDERFISFKMRVNSLFLRMFVPSLRFKFDKNSNEIVEYNGPSNLVNESGSLQNVEIRYKNESEIASAVVGKED